LKKKWMCVCEMCCAVNLKKFRGVLIVLAVLALLAVGTAALVNRLFPVKYMTEIETYAAQYDLPPALVCAVIHAESRFDSEALSSARASGLMQLVRMTADWGAVEIGMEGYSYGRIFESDINIQLGCWYLQKLIQQYGSVETALAAYNAGSGNVSGWLADARYSKDGKTLDEIPFGETARYVEKVKRNRQIYEIILTLRRYIK